ncbi:MAG TPA: hypothetical protein VG733_10935 [Chthoniobacteraceae bacterium]|nr:hypothetical protein [Chthoniobacteraceae bacterium]
MKASGNLRILALLVATLGVVAAPPVRAGDTDTGANNGNGANDTIWSAVVLGTNEENPKPATPELEKYWDKLRDIFGYNQFQLLGQHLEQMNGTSDHWLIPRKDFFLHVDAEKAEKPGFFKMKFDLYQEKKLLAEMEARISGQNLLFIRGPNYGNGRIIIILMVKK